MKIVVNKVIPFKGYKAMAIYPFLFVREGNALKSRTIIHESIHFKQQKEMLLIGFLLWYAIEWMYCYLFTKDRFSHDAYKNISFEQEAYSHQYFEKYLSQRKRFAWFKYFIK